LRRRNHPGRYVLDGKDDAGVMWAKLDSPTKRVRFTISRRTANEWHVDGEAPVETSAGSPIPYTQHYGGLVEGGGVIVSSNLVRSDSHVCLAGRIAGESETRSTLAAVRMTANGCVADLAELLTVHGWTPGSVSRVSFFNARTGRIDRATRPPAFLVADGESSLLRVLERVEFEQSDVVGVVHRAVDRATAEELGSKLAALGQWYTRDREGIADLPRPPRGVEVSILKRAET
jgi:hypothetical protein